jgi:hypothetical protein
MPAGNTTQQEILDGAKAQKKSPLPTPPVGYAVQWYEGGRRENVRAAIVTKVEGPGRVMLAVISPNSFVIHKSVHHADHPVHKRQNAPEAARNGTWDYLPDTKIPASHHKLHIEQLDRQITAVENQILEVEQRKEEEIKNRTEKLAAAGV